MKKFSRQDLLASINYYQAIVSPTVIDVAVYSIEFPSLEVGGLYYTRDGLQELKDSNYVRYVSEYNQLTQEEKNWLAEQQFYLKAKQTALPRLLEI